MFIHVCSKRSTTSMVSIVDSRAIRSPACGSGGIAHGQRGESNAEPTGGSGYFFIEKCYGHESMDILSVCNHRLSIISVTVIWICIEDIYNLWLS